MNPLDLLRFAASALKGHGLRTLLSLTGVAVGVTAVLALTALGEGARLYVTDQFQRLGSDLIIVIRGRTQTTGALPFGGTPYDLTLDDARAVARDLPQVSVAAPLSMGTAAVSWRGRDRSVPVVGTTAEFQPLRQIQLDSGRFLPSGDWDRGARVVVIGRTVQEELFDEVNPLGKIVRLDDWRFRVIGVLASRGESVGLNLDDLVMVPVSTGLRLFNKTSLFRIFARARIRPRMEAAKTAIRTLITARHDNHEDITLITQDSMLSSFNRILHVLTLAIAGIAAVSLAVAGIGVMNVMLVSVSERTEEVGLLLALGVRKRQILTLFLTEAALLAFLGGLLGLLAGYSVAAATRNLYPALPASPPNWAVAAVLVLSVLVGLVAGVIPARRAAALDPVVSLSQGRGV